MEIPKDLQEQVKEFFAPINRKVTLRVFSKGSDCTYCKDTLSLSKTLAGLSDWVKVEEYDLEKNADMVQKYGVEEAPAVLIHSEDQDWPMRFYGIPAGYEFQTFVESIVMAGTGSHGLASEVESKAKSITEPKEILVFVTPSCPYCGPAVLTAFKLAMANPENIKAAMVEATEFPELSSQFQVSSVPKIVINRSGSFVGSLPAEKFLSEVMKG